MEQKYTYKFRLYPTKEQEILLNKHFGAVRWVWNHFLERRQRFYLEAKEKQLAKKQLYYAENCSEVVSLKKSPETQWLREVGAQSLQQSLKNLDAAYNNFFKKRAQFPKFKCRHGKNTFRDPQGVEVDDEKLYIAKFSEGIKTDNHRKVEGRIKHATVSKSKSGRYFAAIMVEREIAGLPLANSQIGVDLGLTDLVVTSSGRKYGRLKIPKNLLRIRQKAISRAKKGSRTREKARLTLARLHEKINNRRSDFLHKISRELIDENQVIVLESFNVKGMMQNHHLAGAIGNAAWSDFVTMLKYKAAWYGRQIVQIDRWFPSSKTCGSCGYVLESLPLSARSWVCFKCGSKHDRDINAASNILKQGLNLLSVGTTV
jgi:putative transposase